MGDDGGLLLNISGLDGGAPPRARKRPANSGGGGGGNRAGGGGGAGSGQGRNRQHGGGGGQQKKRPRHSGDDDWGDFPEGGGGGWRGRNRDRSGDDPDSYGGDGDGGGAAQKRPKPRKLVVEDAASLPGLRAPAVSAAARAQLFAPSAAAAAAASKAPPDSFEALGVPEKVAEHLRGAMALERPTRVQALTVPVMLSTRDVLVRSETGSGKTLAYLLPVVCGLAAVQPRVTRADGTLALILAPTRELCIQILETAQTLCRPTIWLVPGAVMGGESRQKEKSRLRKGVTILCATPGRLVDHVRSTQAFKVSGIRFLVFDEADRLLDLGFEENIKEILEHLEKVEELPHGVRRCTALLSATLPPTLERLTEVALTNPVRIVASRDGAPNAGGGTGAGRSTRWADDDDGSDGDGGSGSDGGGAGAGAGPSSSAAAASGGLAFPQQLRQEFVVVPCKARAAVLLAALRDLLRKGTQRVLCFLSTCESAEYHFRLFSALQLEGQPALPCAAHRLHGDLPQAERQRVFREFNDETRAGVLFCTDVAARGLDFAAVGASLQVDLASPQDYCHRVGRTARMGHEGSALAFVLPSEREYAAQLRALGAPLQQARAGPMLDKLLARRGGAGGKGGKGRFGGGGVGMPAGMENADEAARHPVVQFSSSSGGGGSAGSHAHKKSSNPPPQVVQGALQGLLRAEPELFTLAEAAFRAHVRAYATHPASMKHIFHVKKLHLGHLAAAFGLEQPPSVMAGEGKKKKKMQGKLARAGGGAGGGGGGGGGGGNVELEREAKRERRREMRGAAGKRRIKEAMADVGRFNDDSD